MLTYDAKRSLIGEARLLIKDRIIDRRVVSLLERLAAALEDELNDETGRGPVS